MLRAVLAVAAVVGLAVASGVSAPAERQVVPVSMADASSLDRDDVIDRDDFDGGNGGDGANG